jgi:YidC/Oxa1 family membrane protein insertase
MKEIQERYKDNPQQLADETMKLFKWSWNPLKWCLMMFVQMPVFIWLFYVVQNISKTWEDVNNKEDIYSFIYNYVHTGIDNINSIFLWMDLFSKADFSSLSIHALILALLAWILMYIQIKLTTLNRPSTPSMPAGMWNMPGMPQLPDMNKMMWYMNIFMVVMMSSFVYIMPSGVWLYIVTSTLFTITQYTIQYRQLIKVKFNAWKNK